MTIAENLNKFSQEFEEIKSEFTGRARKMFTASLKELFDQNETLGQIVWEQFTPYFNDGDECVFGVYEPSFVLANALEEEEEYIDRYEREIPRDELNDDMRAVSRFIQNQDDLMQSLYGDHVTVLVKRTKDGIVIEVEEYEHE